MRGRLLSWLRHRRDQRRQACRITEEWCGHFIGRKYCSTHNVVWDDGGSCPERYKRAEPQ